MPLTKWMIHFTSLSKSLGRSPKSPTPHPSKKKVFRVTVVECSSDVVFVVVVFFGWRPGAMIFFVSFFFRACVMAACAMLWRHTLPALSNLSVPVSSPEFSWTRWSGKDSWRRLVPVHRSAIACKLFGYAALICQDWKHLQGNKTRSSHE